MAKRPAKPEAVRGVTTQAEKKEPMTSSDLKARLLDDDSIVAVRRHTLGGSMGSRPKFNVVGVYRGFDWDHGQVFLELDFPVQAAGDEFKRERRVASELSETIGFLYLALTHKHATAQEKLDAVVRTLRARTGMKLADCIPGVVPDVMTPVRALVEAEMAKCARVVNARKGRRTR